MRPQGGPDLCLIGRVPFVLFMQHAAENQPDSLCERRFFIA
ncbi:MAG: hypothetical protein JWN71_3869 [Xanthobacteraceae bacterium]|nr:hypothetical protein [Xanthobacteraceae bacterium]